MLKGRNYKQGDRESGRCRGIGRGCDRAGDAAGAEERGAGRRRYK